MDDSVNDKWNFCYQCEYPLVYREEGERWVAICGMCGKREPLPVVRKEE